MTDLPITIAEPTIAPLLRCRLGRLRVPRGMFKDLAVGDRLWLREPFRFQARFDKLAPSAAVQKGAIPHFPTTLAPGAIAALGLGKARKPSSLPKACHRNHLLVTEVEIAPLQATREEEMRAEGFAGRNAWVDAWDAATADRAHHRWSDNPDVLVFQFTLQKRPLPAGDAA